MSGAFPMVAVRTPDTGQLSRKERGDLADFGRQLGLKVYDDIRSLEKNFASQIGAYANGPERAKTIRCCWQHGPARPVATVPRRRCWKRADSSGCMRGRSTTSVTNCWTRAT